MNKDAVSVTNINQQTTRHQRQLLAEGVSILYVIMSKSITTESVTTLISSAITSGDFTTVLLNQLVLNNINASVSANVLPLVTNISPTPLPTRSPTLKPTPKFTSAPTMTPLILISQVTKRFKNIKRLCVHFLFN